MYKIENTVERNIIIKTHVIKINKLAHRLTFYFFPLPPQPYLLNIHNDKSIYLYKSLVLLHSTK